MKKKKFVKISLWPHMSRFGTFMQQARSSEQNYHSSRTASDATPECWFPEEISYEEVKRT
jgi:hypothetical protein